MQPFGLERVHCGLISGISVEGTRASEASGEDEVVSCCSSDKTSSVSYYRSRRAWLSYLDANKRYLHTSMLTWVELHA